MNYTQNWIDNKDIKPHWERILKPLFDRPITMLEIGCFEGRSTAWFLENVLVHKDSRIVCIDTFGGDEQQYDMGVRAEGMKERFLQNIKKYEKKVHVIQGRSQNILKDIIGEFDVIYIDGSHYQVHVLEDMVLSFPLLKKGGIMICDDYEMEYSDKFSVSYKPKVAIDSFINVYRSHLRTLHRGWQYIIEKT